MLSSKQIKLMKYMYKHGAICWSDVKYLRIYKTYAGFYRAMKDLKRRGFVIVWSFLGDNYWELTSKGKNRAYLYV